MKIQVSAQVLLLIAIVLLAANLVVSLGVTCATPAYAQGRTCVGVAAAATCAADGGSQQWALYRAWSDGSVDARYGSSPSNSF